MSDTLANLRRKIDGAGKLKSVVRTMKTLAASSIGQYETAVRALEDYERTVTLGLAACFRQTQPLILSYFEQRTPQLVDAIVFGSDQGLVGQFNDVMADFLKKTLDNLPGEKRIWVVGERLHARLVDVGFSLAGVRAVPNSVAAITPLVGYIQIDVETERKPNANQHVYVFHNRPTSGSQYEPVCQRLLPLDGQWQKDLATVPWPTTNLPEALGSNDEALPAFIGEYLFVLLFKACAESLSSENASRLAAMQRAEKNIDVLSTQLSSAFHRLRQSSIDEELFDVITGFNALTTECIYKRK